MSQVAQEWIQVGIEQYRCAFFDAAEEAFRRSQDYQEYLTAADRERLNELLQKTAKAALVRKRILDDIQTVDGLLEQGQQPGKVKAYLQKLKGCEFLTVEEREQIADRLKKMNHLPNEPVNEPRKKPPVTIEPIAIKELAETAPPARVAFRPGDEIEIKFFYTPELNLTQAVRPDGKISLELIDEVKAEGKTAAELRAELLKLYEPYLKAPEIAVVVLSLHNRRVFVGGQVMTPGIVETPGEMTALGAIMQAGGFDMREAEPGNVIVIRYRGARRYAYKLNLKPATVGDETQPFLLEPEDIVYVPRTKIAKVNQWIDQHINKLIPDTGIFFRRAVGRTTYGTSGY